MTTYYRFVVDDEHTAARWWDEARERTDIPPELRPLLFDPNETAVIVPRPRADDLFAWVAAIPGWDDDAPEYAPYPLIVEDWS